MWFLLLAWMVFFLCIFASFLVTHGEIFFNRRKGVGLHFLVDFLSSFTYLLTWMRVDGWMDVCMVLWFMRANV